MSHRAKDIIGISVSDRWMAEIYYHDNALESTVVTVSFEEIEDLDEIIERGRDWNQIEKIVITLNRPSVEPLTEVSHG